MKKWKWKQIPEIKWAKVLQNHKIGYKENGEGLYNGLS